MRRHCPARRGRVGHCEDEPDLLPALLRKGHAFELPRPQLCLKIAQAPLNLDMDDPRGTVEDHVSGSPIWRWSDRDLEAHTPRLMGRRPNQLGQFQLA